MSYPGVSILVENGNLKRSITVLDGIGAFIATASTVSNIGKVQVVYSLPDAEQKGYTKDSEPFLYNLINEFYTELGGNMQLYVMGVPETMTMTDIVTSTNQEGLLKLMTEAEGGVNLVSLARKPSEGYDAGTGFLDKDVESAVLASSALCKSLQSNNTPVRLFIEGRIVNETEQNTFIPNESENGFAGVVLGGTSDDGSAAVSIAMARACRYGAHVKLGSGRNGALGVSQIYIGSHPMESRLDMKILHDAGFLTFMRRPGAAGYYFGVDNMCESGDFRILVHGRVIDKAQRITAAAYLPFIEDYVRVNPDGSINETDAKHMEDILKAAIRTNMGDQISDVDVVIDTNQDIVNTHKLTVKVRILPLGYLTWIEVVLGLTAQITSN